jgi:GAF domain-containing protein
MSDRNARRPRRAVPPFASRQPALGSSRVRLRHMHHIVQVPVVCGESLLGTINLGTSDPDRAYTTAEVGWAEALGRLVGVAVEGIRARGDLEHELERAWAALELTGSAIVVSDSVALEVRLSEAARRLLAQLQGGRRRVGAAGPCSRRSR